MPVVRAARILSLSDPGDRANAPLHTDPLPDGATLEAVMIAAGGGGGTTNGPGEIPAEVLERCNVLFVSHPAARDTLAELLPRMPRLEWIHSRSAGIDFITSDRLSQWKGGTITNAKGMFSSTLSEYCMAVCSYFAKDFDRLRRQQGAAVWDPYCVLELRGATLGVIGYGDIGKTSARLAKAYGMRVVATRRRPSPDEHCDEMLRHDTANMNRVFAESDYVLCALPLTADTNKMIGREQFEACRPGRTVFINVGRGMVVDEEAMIDCLKSKRLKGAALDVVATEPLPATSPLWALDNVLLSPHNMDRTETFMEESTRFFVQEQLPRFVRGLPVLNPVDAAAGY
jgi:phosphoglycerate dehydrogenase-like enzyme